jgi:hypothetical protein
LKWNHLDDIGEMGQFWRIHQIGVEVSENYLKVIVHKDMLSRRLAVKLNWCISGKLF